MQSNQTQQTAPRQTPPTEKMLSAAKKAAAKHCVEIPVEVPNDFNACKVFLDQYLNLPTTKQVAFAQKLSKSQGVPLSDDLLKNARELSDWIDQIRPRYD